MDVESVGEVSRTRDSADGPRFRWRKGTRKDGRRGVFASVGLVPAAVRLVRKSWYSSRRARSQKKTLEAVLHMARTGLDVADPGYKPKRMNMMLLSGTANCRSRVYWRVLGFEVGEVKAERVSRAESCVVGADRGLGGGFAEENPDIAHSTIHSSSWHLERIRSLWNATLDSVRGVFGGGKGERGGTLPVYDSGMYFRGREVRIMDSSRFVRTSVTVRKLWQYPLSCISDVNSMLIDVLTRFMM